MLSCHSSSTLEPASTIPNPSVAAARQLPTGFRYTYGGSNERLVALDKKLDRVISGLDQTKISLTNLEERVEKLEESLLDKSMKVVLRVTQQQGEV